MGSDDRHTISGLGLNQQYLAVIVSKIGALDNLSDESPKFERLVGRLVVEDEVYAADFVALADEEQAPQKLLGD